MHAHGAECCTDLKYPVRRGNGYVDQLIASGAYHEPTLRSIEAAFDQALELGAAGRIFVDLLGYRALFPLFPMRTAAPSSVCGR